MNKTYSLDELYGMLNDVREERIKLCEQIKSDLIAFASNSGDLPSEDAEEKGASPKLLDQDFSKNSVRSMSASHNEQLKLLDKREKRILKLIEERESIAYFKQYTVLRHECVVEKAEHIAACRAHEPQIAITWREDFWGNLGDLLFGIFAFFTINPIRALIIKPTWYVIESTCAGIAKTFAFLVNLIIRRKPPTADAVVAET